MDELRLHDVCIGVGYAKRFLNGRVFGLGHVLVLHGIGQHLFQGVGLASVTAAEPTPSSARAAMGRIASARVRVTSLIKRFIVRISFTLHVAVFLAAPLL